MVASQRRDLKTWYRVCPLRKGLSRRHHDCWRQSTRTRSYHQDPERKRQSKQVSKTVRRADFAALGTEGYPLKCPPGWDVEMLAWNFLTSWHPLEMHGFLEKDYGFITIFLYVFLMSTLFGASLVYRPTKWPEIAMPRGHRASPAVRVRAVTLERRERRRVPCVEAALRISDIKSWIYGKNTFNTFNTRRPFAILWSTFIFFMYYFEHPVHWK